MEKAKAPNGGDLFEKGVAQILYEAPVCQDVVGRTDNRNLPVCLFWIRLVSISATTASLQATDTPGPLSAASLLSQLAGGTRPFDATSLQAGLRELLAVLSTAYELGTNELGKAPVSRLETFQIRARAIAADASGLVALDFARTTGQAPRAGPFALSAPAVICRRHCPPGFQQRSAQLGSWGGMVSWGATEIKQRNGRGLGYLRGALADRGLAERGCMPPAHYVLTMSIFLKE